MPTLQTVLLIRTLHHKLALFALLWLASLSCLSWPAPAAAQTNYFEPSVFQHPDLNGNTVMASNAAGQIIWQERLEPYGRKSVLSNSAAGGSGADQGFHGKTRDEETGLIYFGARHYHPLLGRFLSTDPVEAQSDNLHSFNRYVFANNNPYKYTDPDGQIPLPIIAYYGVTALTPVVSGLAVRFAASRVAQFGLSVAAGEVGLAVPGAVVVGKSGLEGAKFAQKTFGSMFSKEGTFAGRSVDEVAASLRSGALKPSQMQIDFIVRDGNTLILNTRSAQALEAAGIPRSAWTGVNRTGQEAFESMLNGQLQRNGLTNEGIDVVRRAGGM